MLLAAGRLRHLRLGDAAAGRVRCCYRREGLGLGKDPGRHLLAGAG